VRRRTVRFSGIINDIPLNYKFLLIFVIGILLPIIVINLMFMDRMSNLITEREEQNLQISLERARKDIHNFIDGGVAVSHALNTDKTLYEMLERRYESPITFYDTFDEQLRHRVNSYIPVNSQILRIRVYTDNTTIVPGSSYYNLSYKVKSSEWYKLWKQSSDKVVVGAYTETRISDMAVTSPYLSVMEQLDSFDGLNTYEKLARIDLDLDKIYDVIVRERDYLTLYLVDKHNRIIVSADKTLSGGEQQAYPVFELPQEADSDVHVVSIGTASYVKGWKLIGVPQGTRLSKATRDMQMFVFMLAAGMALFASGFIYIMLRSYNYRVKRLSRHMHKVTNEKFDLIRMDEGRDEIGGLIQSFNMMTARMNSLINNVYKLEIQKKSLEMEQVRAELNVLQSQMNPHFLFNTLNAILVVCTKNNYTDVTDIIKSLSKLLRRLLSWKEDLVTVQEELRFLEMYLKIEKFRFRDKFEYELDIDPQALQYKIPKMSIQPLVENACKHGLQAVEGLGTVQISVKFIEGRLGVTVEDNGIGMTEEKLAEITQAMSSENMTGSSIGIRNVFRRLELYYDDQVKFSIMSEWNEGTRVSFEIPMKLMEQSKEGLS